MYTVRAVAKEAASYEAWRRLMALRRQLKMSRRSEWLRITLVLLLQVGMLASAQSPETDTVKNAERLYNSGKWPEAERSFASIVREHPDNIAAQMYLGQTLFHEEKYAAAIAPYEKVRSFEKSGVKLTTTQHRILVDQLAMAYGISGRTADSKALLQESVRSDPDYPLNYYNLACVAADENDKPAVLKNLTLAFQHRGQVLPGEQMPDPSSDPSFQKYAQDSEFKALVNHLKN
jgi:predicted Zn-dependent protease